MQLMTAAGRKSPGLICLVEDDPEQAALLDFNLHQAGFDVAVFAGLEAFRAQVESRALQPAAVIMDLMFPEGALAGAHLIQELQLDAGLDFPVVFISSRNDIHARLAAQRAGAVAYLNKPLDPGQLIFRLNSLLHCHDPWRVLLLADNNTALRLLAGQLESEGMVLQLLDDPMLLLQAYQAFQPDVLLMDASLPLVKRLELPRLLREYQGLEQRPVFLMVDDLDDVSRLQGLTRDTDDFLVFAIESDQLVSTLIAKARRSRLDQLMQSRTRQSMDALVRHRQALNYHAIVSVADPAGRITYANDQFCRVSGYTREQLLGQNHRILKSDQHPPAFYQQLWKTISAGLIWQGEVCNRARDGSYYWVHSTITPFFDEAGNIREYISIRTDITRLKQTELALSKARDEAEQANQAKSRFLSNMSHELRTPLNAVIGFAQLMECDDSLSEDNRDNVLEISRAGKHLLELINDVLDLARVESGQLRLSMESVQLADLAQECCPLINPMVATHQLRLAVDFPPGIYVWADRLRLKQVLMNLVTNAIKYNRHQGLVRVWVESAGQPGWARILVQDTGQGIPVDKLAELWQPFNRLGAEHSGVEGTGIGLVICRQLIQQMGGRIGVESEVGKGSTFWLELPHDMAEGAEDA
ncbi:ATP-binding protein [Marinospirillum alkaliphilum]|uniref:histidine kinase n=1 Tax=Marinospirillum alkaliphilum DSM 21637 TaxID=1122209 RepID=A0A1K1X3B6_9GAMM|nr:ATP-binding protein [Marinospirillum alkaliphilum]SFX44136.1 PAS domain S-box-containing protein [Marinospirillum alkaliphilum DSM 21637]